MRHRLETKGTTVLWHIDDCCFHICCDLECELSSRPMNAGFVIPTGIAMVDTASRNFAVSAEIELAIGCYGLVWHGVFARHKYACGGES